MIDVGAICGFLKAFAPLEQAAEWDNVGLLLGDEAVSVQRIMTCLTITPTIAREAITKKADLIVSHHPILFRPVQKLNSLNPEGRMLLALARAGVAVYSPHTAFDNTVGGINEMIAERLNVTDLKPLRPRDANESCKVVVFVPELDLSKVSDAVFSAGAGNIGQYKECSFRVSGQGTFFGLESAHPTIGSVGHREEIKEWRLEVVCPKHNLEAVIAAIRKAHSYEEPAFDIYPLNRVKSATSGEGRIGRLSQPLSLSRLALAAQSTFQAGQVQWVGPDDKIVERVAIVCGAGGDFWKDAVKMGADALLTGEARFHDCLAAETHGLALVLLGHYASERFAVEKMANLIHDRWPEITVEASQSERDPLRFS